jgi:hypothetical protein
MQQAETEEQEEEQGEEHLVLEALMVVQAQPEALLLTRAQAVEEGAVARVGKLPMAEAVAQVGG